MHKRPTTRDVFFRDLVSAVLYSGSRFALMSLIPFIAVKRLGAAPVWVGVLTSGFFLGYFWNLFFSRLTARLSLRRGIVAIIVLAASLNFVVAFQTSVWRYCLAALCGSIVGGLLTVQYDTLLHHLYTPDERPRLLSYRWLAISLAGAVFSPVFGKLSSGPAGHLPAFLLAGGVALAAALIFRSIRMQADHHMVPFRMKDVLDLVRRDRRFRRMALVLIVYGWLGVGLSTILVLLYKHMSFDEWQVGLFSSVSTIGMVLTTLAITPFMRFRGSLSNFKLCFTGGAAAAAFYFAAVVLDAGSLTVWLIGAGNLAFGVANGGFALGSQTSALNIAPEGKASLYVSAFKFVQGIRGLVVPIVVAALIPGLSIVVVLASALVVGLFCTSLVWVPGIDGKAPPAQDGRI